mmetsp:Transcript_64580/g.154311  ORF Transcript_64580/g.154311 Transcript_64580/m.154311 type:complete len:247 (+) Transcript_64580:105-845(+)
MATMARRLGKELPQLRAKSLREDGLALEETKGTVQIGGDAKGCTDLVALLAGPRDSPYEGGVFRLRFLISPQYPMDPPKVCFQTKIFHPNVGRGHTPGAICLDILRKEAWSPALTLERILISIASLLADPNPNSPMDTEAANLYMTDRPAYDRRVKDTVLKFASPSGSQRDCNATSGAWLGDYGKDDEGAAAVPAVQSGSGSDAATAAKGTAPAAAAPVIDLSDGDAEPAQPAAKKRKTKKAAARR